MITKPLYTYDEETYPNCFLLGAKLETDSTVHVFEISSRMNQKQELLNFLSFLKNQDAHMVGYNNLGFDSPILHELLNNPLAFTAQRAYDIAQKIIDYQKLPGFSPYNIPLKDRIIHQIDLMKIWHFDNDAKRTRLKDLQFNMRSDSVEDLPIPVGKILTHEEMDQLKSYMVHDITETEKFLGFTKERLELRFNLLNDGILKGDVLNFNDTKIGEQFFISKLGRENCYDGSKPKGTPRSVVHFNECILPKIDFRKEPFKDVKRDFEVRRWINGDKDHNSTISFERSLAGLKFHFGSGGLHASVERRIFRANETHKIIDIDVSGMYPAVGITNRFYPEHLGEQFVNVYKQLQVDRKNYKKGTAMNAVLKLAQNGVYGKSNSEYSPMFDVKYLFKITLNGQLQLLQLAELVSDIPGVELIQCNTDGITLMLPRDKEFLFDIWKAHWEQDTGLQLEQVEYKAMYIRDVNNYIAQGVDGKMKRKGTYWFPESWKDYDEAAGAWHKDLSMMIVPRVAEQVMLHGYDPLFLLKNSFDKFDFMIREKIKGQQVGRIGDKVTQKTLRYYVSTKGEPLTVTRPAAGPKGEFKRKPKTPDALYNSVMSQIGWGVWDERIHTKNKSKYVDTVTSIQSGWKVKECNKASDFDWSDVDFNFYLGEVEKLIIKESHV